jgi:ribosomal protein L11 methyltransferase
LTDWIEIVVPASAADVDDVAALVASEVTAAAAGTELRGDEIVFWVGADAVAAALEETRAAVARWGLDPARVRTATAMPEAEWRDAWKKYFKVSRLTRQIVVVPSWETYVDAPGDVRVDLDPGMAFGTGTHASTRLVLEEMQALADAGVRPETILDVGCGSGILSIAAVKLWPGARCIAVDNDPLAVDATRDNAAKNGVAIDARLALPDGTFPLVLANIQAHVLRELKDLLKARCAGTLILSGLLTPQAAPLAEEFGMTIVRIRPSTDDAQWSSVVLARPV